MAKQNKTNILLRHGFVSLSNDSGTSAPSSNESIATILMNLEYYGFSLNHDVYKAIKSMSLNALSSWWANLELELKDVTGDDRNIGDFVVYKNFPAEVLNKNEAEYWIPQILMYWGFPNELFTEEVKPREGLDPSERKSVTLRLSDKNTLQNIFNSLLASSARWKTVELSDVLYLAQFCYADLSKVAFKENLINLAKSLIDSGSDVKINTATDVLRLGAALSDGDVSFKERVRFKSFNRKSRKFLLSILNGCNNLEEDVARRAGVWKKFLHQLHPGEYKRAYPKVFKIADRLYNDRLRTFNSKVEELIINKDKEALDLLSSRPGEFARRVGHMIDVFGNDAVESFSKVLPKLNTYQIVTLRTHFENVNHRNHRTFTPKGSWAKVQIAQAKKLDKKCVNSLIERIDNALSNKVPSVSFLDERIDDVKLPKNGSDEGEYTRGTVFKIPDDVEFIRTASYWKNNTGYNVWFDNGWNFFDDRWGSVGTCSWTSVNFCSGSAIFSGDPTSSKEMSGRAAQLIDLYPSKLLKKGVRYAVWNILCYSKIPFSDAEDVFAALQWGKDPQKGKLFEPSRCQLSFKLQGKYYTKYVCVLDLKTRRMTYLDANLKANVHTADSNGKHLSEVMPAFMEYINDIPSVYDLFKQSVDTKNGNGHVIYSDKDILFEENESAYVFEDAGHNKYNKININNILKS